jgi:hypothetical protein
MDNGTVIVILGVSVIAGFTIVGAIRAFRQGPRPEPRPEPAPSELAQAIKAIGDSQILMDKKAELIRQLLERNPLSWSL